MEYDAVVIGSGPGGHECAKRIAELGGKVAIVEKDGLGGICTNYGCIPTKTLHASASLYNDLKKSSQHGFEPPSNSIDFSTCMKRKSRVVKIMSMAVKKMMDEHAVDIFEGQAKIKDSNTVLVEDNELKTKNIVIATGAQPVMLPGIKFNDVIISSSDILSLQELPSSLIIIGAGYIGCEFASIFASLGVDVTVIEKMPSIVSHEDKNISDGLTNLMQRQGIHIFTNSEVMEIKDKTVTFNQDGKEMKKEADKILIAIGLKPYFNKEEMDTLGVKHDQGIIINNKMQTSVANIYAVGDVTCKIMLAHYATMQGEVAARNIMGHPKEFDDNVVPSTIFTIPEISSVGIREDQLDSAIYHFAANGKARAMGEADGFVKVYYEDGYLKGFSAIGPHASDLVSEAALAIKNKIPLEKIRETIHPHPTLSEAFLGAVELALKNSEELR